MSDSRLVYTTDGTQRRDLREPQARREGVFPRATRGKGRAAPVVPNDGVVRIVRERGGRGGKVVTVVRGLPERGAALEARAAELKRLCAAGGAVKGEAIELQGDHRARIAERLRARGYSVKLAGG